MSHLEKYGLELLDNYPSIKESRKFGIITNYQGFRESTIHNLNLDIDLNKYNIVITKKINQEGFFMKWHVDDAQIIKHKKEIEFDNQIKLNQKHYLNYSEMVPEYTLIIYLSTYQVDFTGGTLQFSDDTIIDPQKGMYVFFNSKEPHRLNIIRSGTRSNYLIKFYPKISK